MMKKNYFLFSLLLTLLLAACNSPKGKVIFYPDPTEDNSREQEGSRESWKIIESQNGRGSDGIPTWVGLYADGKVRDIETLTQYSGKYVFIGENHGDNFKSLQQWANGFTTAQDLPRLIARRMEQRFTASAVLYPDDEYGEYFAGTIKKASDEEYQGAVKEETFWIKRQRIPVETEEDSDFPESAQTGAYAERYEFLVLISIDKASLEKKIREIMAGIRTSVVPTRDQAAAINRINNTFFEGF